MTNEQLDKLLSMEVYTFNELAMLEDHLAYIGSIQDEWGNDLPPDIDANLMADLHRIIDRLNKEKDRLGKLKKARKKGLTVIENNDNVDLGGK